MKSIAIFIFGILSGYLLFILLPSEENTADSPNIQSEYVEAAKKEVNQNTQWAEDRASPRNKASDIDILSPQKSGQHVITLPDNRSLINQLSTSSEDAATDLAFLVQKDAAASALVKQAIRNNTSYDMKWKLIHILANDHRPETLQFAVEMVMNGEASDTQTLGLELLSLLDVPEDSSFVSDALIEATYAVSDPDVMTQIIHQLSQHPTDEATKEQITDRLQTMLSESNPDIKAAVIDSLAEISQPQMIQDLSRNYLFDPSDQVKNAAISALFKVNQTQIDQELLNTLMQLIQDPAIAEETRRLATAVLEAHNIPVSNSLNF